MRGVETVAHIECCRYFQEKVDEMAELVDKLSQKYDDCSILGKDRHGTHLCVRPLETTIEPCTFESRGFCLRILDQGHFFEYAFNELNQVDEVYQDVLKTYEQVNEMNQSIACEYGPKVDFYQTMNYESSEAEIHQPLDLAKVVEALNKAKDEILAKHGLIVDCALHFDYSHSSSIFVSNYKQLMQGFIETQLDIEVYTYHQVVHKQLRIKGGMEILDKLNTLVDAACREVLELEDAKEMIPGVYDIICDPYLTGRICHEAFGHDILMDNCLKGQSEAQQYIGRAIASNLVNIVDVSSCLFDDEGNVDEITYLVKDGIFKKGLYDQATASRMGEIPTGNGCRASYATKANTRMTNTYIEKGTSKLEDMIASIEDGYLLETIENNTESLKSWQEQAILCKARAIKNGILKDEIYAPVLLSSSILELLRSVQMVGDTCEMFHHYLCGFQGNDLIHVGVGGPYIKTKGRLG